MRLYCIRGGIRIHKTPWFEQGDFTSLPTRTFMNAVPTVEFESTKLLSLNQATLPVCPRGYIVSPPRVELGTFLMFSTPSQGASFANLLMEIFVRMTGIEPARLSTVASETTMASNYITSALVIPAGYEPALFHFAREDLSN